MITQTRKSFPYIFPVSFWPEMSDRAVNIVGDLYNVSDTGVKRCDKLEDHPTWYERTTIKVKNISGEEFEVEAYILTKNSFDIVNRDKNIILNGDWKKINDS